MIEIVDTFAYMCMLYTYIHFFNKIIAILVIKTIFN